MAFDGTTAGGSGKEMKEYGYSTFKTGVQQDCGAASSVSSGWTARASVPHKSEALVGTWQAATASPADTQLLDSEQCEASCGSDSSKSHGAGVAISTMGKQGSKKTKKHDNTGRHQTFSLELVFVNRIINGSSQHILSKLLGFDAHPRDKPYPSKKYRTPTGSGSGNPELSDCLEYFRQTEKLEKDNSWYCNKCKDHVEATKKIELYRVPPILIFCL